jgi:ribonuclease E
VTTTDAAQTATDAAGKPEGATAEGSGRRRRGRRGGRRRRRQEGAAVADPNAAVIESQDELDFDEEEPGNEAAEGETGEREDRESSENLGTRLPFTAPTPASAIPVTSVESDFDDLDGDETEDEPTADRAAPTAAAPAAVEPAKPLTSDSAQAPLAFAAPAPVVTMAMPKIDTTVAPAANAAEPTLELPMATSEAHVANDGIWSQPAPELRVAAAASVPPVFSAPTSATSVQTEAPAATPAVTLVATSEPATQEATDQDEGPADKTA